MFGRVPFSSPYEQFFGGYPVHPLQQTPFGIPPHLQSQMAGGFGPYGQPSGFPAIPWQNPQAMGLGPISPLVPQQLGASPMYQGQGSGYGQQPFLPALAFGRQPGISDPSAQYQANPYEQLSSLAAAGQWGGSGGQAIGLPGLETPGIGSIGAQQNWQQRDPRAELVANTIAQITATRDPRIEYLSQVVTHPLVASNPVLKDLVAKELLTAALQKVVFKTAGRPEIQGQPFLRGNEQVGFGQVNPGFATGMPTAF